MGRLFWISQLGPKVLIRTLGSSRKARVKEQMCPCCRKLVTAGIMPLSESNFAAITEYLSLDTVNRIEGYFSLLWRLRHPKSHSACGKGLLDAPSFCRGKQGVGACCQACALMIKNP